MIELLPEKYDQLGLNPSEKSFIKIVERAFKEDNLSYFVLHINPRKKGIQDDKSKPELFNLLVFEDGAVLFQMYEIVDTDIATKTIKAFYEYKLFEKLNIDIAERLKQSGYLVTETNALKYAFSIKLMFPHIKKFDVMGNVDNDFLLKHCLLEDDVQFLRHNGKKGFSGLLDKKEAVTEDIALHLFQRLCPELTIVRKFFLDEHQSIAGRDGNIGKDDRAVEVYKLDAQQINFINKIGKGNQLILACAGSGKSVLLISKCFKLASLNPAENFLIACRNGNLRDYYNWAREKAGFSSNGQVEVRTFHELCSYLLKINGIPLPPPQENADEYFKLLVFKASEALRTGKIRQRYYGIFIDEIQIFEPSWYQFCYNLLKSKNEEDHFFVIAGDKSQDLKARQNKGIAPWQGHGDEYPKYSSRTYHPIENNYRNSKPINDAIDRFVKLAKSKGLKLGVDMTSDPELFLRGIAYRDGEEPVIIENNDYSNKGEVNAIIKEIKNLIESKECSESDIAIILYQKSGWTGYCGSWKDKRYDEIEQLLKDAFYREGFNEPTILYSNSDKGTYGARRGVSLASIDGALGLDYRAVILAGLHPIGKRGDAKTESDFTIDPNEDDFIKEIRALGQDDKRRVFVENVNYIYTGCTRAKEYLSIVLSIERGTCVYSDLLREAIGGRR